MKAWNISEYGGVSLKQTDKHKITQEKKSSFVLFFNVALNCVNNRRAGEQRWWHDTTRLRDKRRRREVLFRTGNPVNSQFNKIINRPAAYREWPAGGNLWSVSIHRKSHTKSDFTLFKITPSIHWLLDQFVIYIDDLMGVETIEGGFQSTACCGGNQSVCLKGNFISFMCILTDG